jgi:hypothetical protein
VYNLLNELEARHDGLRNLVFVMKEQIDPQLMPTVKDIFGLLDRYITHYNERSPVYIALWHMLEAWHTAAGHYQYLHQIEAGIPLQQCRDRYRNFQMRISMELDAHESVEDFERSHEADCKKMYISMRNEISNVENIIIGLEELLKTWQETHEAGFRDVLRTAYEKGKAT